MRQQYRRQRNAPARIELDAGETITCTFTNTKRGHIIVDQVTNPSGDPQSFDFDASGGSYADFSLTDAAPPNDQTSFPVITQLARPFRQVGI